MKKVLFAFLFSVIFSLDAFSQPMEIPEGSMCITCGMKVDANSPFIAQIVDKEGKLLTFCDIGDMLMHYKKMKEESVKVYVKDHGSGKWIDALSAVYVKSEKLSTPMSWGIGAFKTKEDAEKFGEALTLDKAIEAVLKTPPKMKMGH